MCFNLKLWATSEEIAFYFILFSLDQNRSWKYLGKVINYFSCPIPVLHWRTLKFWKKQAVLCRYLISCQKPFLFSIAFFLHCKGRDFFIFLSRFTCVYMRKLSKRRISYKTNITKLTAHESHRYIFSFHFFNIIVSYKKIRFLFKECLADTICAATSFWYIDETSMI